MLKKMEMHHFVTAITESGCHIANSQCHAQSHDPWTVPRPKSRPVDKISFQFTSLNDEPNKMKHQVFMKL